MRTKIFYFIITVVILIVSCSDGGSDNDVNIEFVGSKDFVFNALIDTTTLTQEEGFYIRESFFASREETYTIQSNIDLDSFNQTLIEDEKVLLADLDTYTYFFIRSPGCPDSFDYSNHNYSNNLLTISLDHFHQPDVMCLTVMEEFYIVFKAKKSS